MKLLREKKRRDSTRTPFTDATECKRRRTALLRQLGRRALAVVVAAPSAKRSRDINYPYRPDSDFVYLTGFREPGAIAVFAPARREGEYILFCSPCDRQREIWEGRRAGLSEATRKYGADKSFAIETFSEVFPGIASAYEMAYLPMDKGSVVLEQKLLDCLRQADGRMRCTLAAVEKLLYEMRMRKSRSEIALMKKAAMISAAAHRRAMKMCRPGLYEYHLAAEISHEFQCSQAECAYPSIVGGGANGCVLHYMDNRNLLKRGDLVLVDAGAEYRGYASDVTRTFPVGGRFSAAQRELYEIVLEAQGEALAKVRPGNSWDDVHTAAVRVLVRGLVTLGLLKGRVPALIKRGEYQRFYMHRTGHWLGMDVHDPGDYHDGGIWRRFEPGMALTVEPGLYIHANSGASRRWRNIGIRIEDSVVVTRDGAQVLSDAVPKETDAVEALCLS